MSSLSSASTQSEGVVVVDMGHSETRVLAVASGFPLLQSLTSE
jgi:actin-related protein